MNPGKYCEICPRAILCIARGEETLPLATCVTCTEVFDLELVGSSDYIRNEQTNLQGLVPPKRSVCPRDWAYFDASREMPFTCKSCSKTGYVRYGGGGVWGFGRSQ
jgi:hypothetical protein